VSPTNEKAAAGVGIGEKPRTASLQQKGKEVQRKEAEAAAKKDAQTKLERLHVQEASQKGVASRAAPNREKSKVSNDGKSINKTPSHEGEGEINHCPDPRKETPTEIFWGQEVTASITGTCYQRYELKMPPYERAPFNLHFNLYTRDQAGKDCGGVVMRLRKNCGDVSVNPQACSTPPKGFVKPFIDTRSPREVKMGSDVAMYAAYEQRKRLEWFEENPYTRELNGAVDLDFNECGCKDGEERWVDRATRKEVWYVEIKNDAAPNTLCDVSFLPTAVDICQGHGTWRSNGEGCVCDNGYDGQYQGPVESLSTQKKKQS